MIDSQTEREQIAQYFPKCAIWWLLYIPSYNVNLGFPD